MQRGLTGVSARQDWLLGLTDAHVWVRTNKNTIIRRLVFINCVNCVNYCFSVYDWVNKCSVRCFSVCHV